MSYTKMDGENELGRERPSSANEVGRFGERLRKAMGNRSQRHISEMSGLSSGTVHNLLRGGTPNLSSAVQLSEITGVSLEWLATGRGSMRPDHASDSTCADPHPDEFAYIPLLAVEACAGHGSFVDSEEIITKLAFRRDWLHTEVHANPAHLHLIYVRGDSMEPTLSDGEVIMIDRSVNAPNHDGIFVIQMDDAILIKRIQPLPGNRLRIMSDNKRYPDIEADLQQHPLRLVGKVIWHAGRI